LHDATVGVVDDVCSIVDEQPIPAIGLPQPSYDQRSAEQSQDHDQPEERASDLGVQRQGHPVGTHEHGHVHEGPTRRQEVGDVDREHKQGQAEDDLALRRRA